MLVLVREKIEAFRYHLVRMEDGEQEEKAIGKVPDHNDCGLVVQSLEEGNTLALEVLPFSSAKQLCTDNGLRQAQEWIEANDAGVNEVVQGPTSKKTKEKNKNKNDNEMRKLTAQDIKRMIAGEIP